MRTRIPGGRGLQEPLLKVSRSVVGAVAVSVLQRISEQTQSVELRLDVHGARGLRRALPRSLCVQERTRSAQRSVRSASFLSPS